MALHTLEICSGVGMLGEGLRAGLAHMGIQTRTVCHIEREAFAAAVLASRIEEGSMDAAPIWSDLLTFDAGAWSGAVDCIVAGFPCQDLSLAGRRAGLDGKRSGLFFNILDIADSCGAQFLFLENVAGIASATATVVDEAEGELEERAAARVMGELAERGWNAEWLTLSAASVGASHKRERWFCWAWRDMANAKIGRGSIRPDERRGDGAGSCEAGGAAQCIGRGAVLDNAGRMQRSAGHEQDRLGSAEASEYEAHDRPADRSGLLGNPQLHGHTATQDREGIAAGNDHHQTGALNARELARPDDADGQMGYASSQRCKEHGQRREWELSTEASGGVHHRPEQPSRKLANPECPHIERPRDTGDMACPCSQDESGNGSEQWPAADGCGNAVAGPSQPGREGREQRGALFGDGYGQKAHGSTGELCRSLFAHGPNDPRWADIIQRWPHLAPSLPKEAEPQLCGVADGLASGLDDTRTGRLRAGGNGVVALCAAAAADTLVGRMMA